MTRSFFLLFVFAALTPFQRLDHDGTQGHGTAGDQANVEGNTTADQLHASGIGDHFVKAVQEQQIRYAHSTGNRNRIGSQHHVALGDKRLQPSVKAPARSQIDEHGDGDVAESLQQIQKQHHFLNLNQLHQ